MRNAVFLGIITLLIGYIYFFEEKKAIEVLQDKAKAEALLDIKEAGELKYLKGNNFELAKDGDSFKIKKHFTISQKQLDTFLSQLLNIRVQRVLTPTELVNIPAINLLPNEKISVEAGFSENKLTITLGKKIEFNQNFYLSVFNHKTKQDKWVVAKFQNEYTARSQDKQAHRSAMSYNQAKSLFLLSDNFFKEHNPLYNVQKFQRLKISSFRNRAYSIVKSEYRTEPSAPKEIHELEGRFVEYFKGLNELKAQRVLNANKHKLNESIGKLEFDKVIMTVFKKLDGIQGYYLVNEGSIFVIDSKTYRYMFTPQQFFWNKKPELESESFKIFKNNKLVLETNINAKNIWAQVLGSEAYSVRENYKKKFKSFYEIQTGKKIFLVGQSSSGLELYDTEKDLIFHYLEKIK